MNEFDVLLEKLQKNIYRDTVIKLVDQMKVDIESSQSEMTVLKAQFESLSGIHTQADLDLYVKMFTLNERIAVQRDLLQFTLDTLTSLQNS